jgi:hypothetical protein
MRPGRIAPNPAIPFSVSNPNNDNFSHDELARRLVNLMVLYRSGDVLQRRRRAGFQHVSEIIFGDLPEERKAA